MTTYHIGILEVHADQTGRFLHLTTDDWWTAWYMYWDMKKYDTLYVADFDENNMAQRWGKRIRFSHKGETLYDSADIFERLEI